MIFQSCIKSWKRYSWSTCSIQLDLILFFFRSTLHPSRSDKISPGPQRIASCWAPTWPRHHLKICGQKLKCGISTWTEGENWFCWLHSFFADAKEDVKTYGQVWLLVMCGVEHFGCKNVLLNDTDGRWGHKSNIWRWHYCKLGDAMFPHPCARLFKFKRALC